MTKEEEIAHLQGLETFINQNKYEHLFDQLSRKLTDEIRRCQNEKSENRPYISNLIQTRDKQMDAYINAKQKRAKNKRDKDCPDEFDTFVRHFLHDIHDGLRFWGQ
jgi:hypothetical protein